MSRRRVLRHRNFRQFLMSQAAGQVADSMTTLCLAKVIVFDLERGASPGALGRALVTSGLPVLLAGPLAGAAADRWHRRRALAGATVLRAVLTLAGAAVVLTSDRLVGYAVAGALLTVARLLYTVRAAALPHVVDSGDLVTADSLALTTGSVSGLTGAGLAALGLMVSPLLVLCCAAGLHCSAAAGFYLLPCDLGGSGRRDRRRTRRFTTRTGGPAMVLSDESTRFALVATSGHRLLLGAAFATFVLLADARYEMEASGYAAALAVMALGTFAGTLAGPAMAERMSRHQIAVAAYSLAGAAFLTAGLAPSTAVVMGAMTLGSFAFQNLRLTTDALVQRSTSDETLGRVFAIYDVAYNLAFVVGGLVVVSAGGRQSAWPFLPIGMAFLGIVGLRGVAMFRPVPALLRSIR